MLEIIKVGADPVPGVGMVLSLDRMLMGLASIPVDSDTNLYYAKGIIVKVFDILNLVPLWEGRNIKRKYVCSSFIN